jgi:peptidoglycan/LPS O-acetylase OafA/YrhL
VGLIRLILAYSVVLGHASDRTFPMLTVPAIAVQVFYLLSGFYISLVLAKGYPRRRDFYANRLLRLLPAYWAVLAAALVFYGCTADFIPRFLALPAGVWIPFAAVQATLLGIDLSMFTGLNAGHLGWVQFYGHSHPPLYTLLLVPQAWSLGVEIWFYLLAPFIVQCRLRWIAVLIGLSLACRLALIRAGLTGDPWNYRFFPSELATFLLGVLASRCYLSRPDFFSRHRATARFLLLADVLFLVFFSDLWGGVDRKRILLLLLVAASLPFVFALGKDSRWDRLIGNFSYPIYIGHILVMDLWTRLFGTSFRIDARVQALFLLVVLLVAAALHLAVERPIERWRAAIRRRAAAPAGG